MKRGGTILLFVIVFILAAVIAYYGGHGLGEWMATTQSSEGSD